MKCKYCGFEMPSGAKFCEECGAAFEEKITYKKENQQYGNNQQGYGYEQYNNNQGYNQNQGYDQHYRKNPQHGNYINPKYCDNSPNPGSQFGFQPLFYKQQNCYQQSDEVFRQNAFGNAGNPNYDTLYNTADYNMTADSPRYVDWKEALKLYFKNYSNFSGRSTRSEYWYANLALGVILTLLLIINAVIYFSFGRIAASAFFLLLIIGCIALIPSSLSLTVRRLHDSGRSCFTLFIVPLAPLFGAIILLILLTSPSEPANMYGPAPNPDVHAYDPNHINML